MRATKAIIHLDRFTENIRIVWRHTGAGLVCVPVKADAYGHGAVPLARAALEAGAEYLAVATVDEGAELRDAGIDAPILLLSQAVPEEASDIVRYGLTPFIGDKEAARILNTASASASASAAVAGAAGDSGTLKVHLKIDTGMGRAGCLPAEAVELAAYIASLPNLALAGTATHLAVSDSLDPEAVSYTHDQLRRFDAALAALRSAGFDPGIVSAANSGACVQHLQAVYDMIRPGIIVY
jgi:alanine racemase